MRILAGLSATGLLVVGIAGAVHGQTRPAPAQAQPPSPRLPAGFLSLNAGAQLLGSDLQSNVTFPLHTEEADFNADYGAPAGLVLDLGGGVRVWRQLALGAAVTRFQSQADVSLDARLPHPLLLGRDRELTASLPDLERVETAVHIQVAWLIPMEDRVTLAVFGGPTMFRVEQDVVTGLALDETYPFDEVELDSAVTEQRNESAIGFHVGADVLYRLTRRAGVGAVARYSRGTATLETRSSQQSDVTLGGLQLTGGFRWQF